MIYTPMTKTAMRICYDAHTGQIDKTGLPYVFHPYHLAEQMQTEECVCAALLHDVIEDTNVTLEDLRAAGISDPVLEALSLLTHDPQVPYFEYVRALSSNPIARAVKIADLRHNSDLTRLDAISPKDEQRAKKYAKALELLGAV
ncbi:MAG: GTP pyrophosphokinase [Atopobiaceae bacterium]|nr:GTP pyrophosphokinase [Atopobiaceae bacterium]